jgi:hypothetical protein
LEPYARGIIHTFGPSLKVVCWVSERGGVFFYAIWRQNRRSRTAYTKLAATPATGHKVPELLPLFDLSPTGSDSNLRRNQARFGSPD